MIAAMRWFRKSRLQSEAHRVRLSDGRRLRQYWDPHHLVAAVLKKAKLKSARGEMNTARKRTPELRGSSRFRSNAPLGCCVCTNRDCSRMWNMDSTAFLRDFKFAVRSLARTKGLAITVIVTLALGIGANAAIFTLVRGVLLRPLVNRDEDRLIYIRQSAPGIGAENVNFSVPELNDLRAAVKTLSEFGDFSTVGVRLGGVGEPREIRAGVVGGTYFETMGLHPVLGRLLDARDDGPKAAGAVVLTYRFWMTALHSDPSVLGKTVRLESVGPARAA